jgi:hypothetical protein
VKQSVSAPKWEQQERESEKITIVGQNSKLLTCEFDLILVKLVKEGRTIYFFSEMQKPTY